jgi:hypothetical protein
MASVCETRYLRIIEVPNDAVSSKTAWAKLAVVADYARAGHLRRNRDLQRDLHARRSRRRRFLAQTGELGGGRILRVHGGEFG